MLNTSIIISALNESFDWIPMVILNILNIDGEAHFIGSFEFEVLRLQKIDANIFL